MPKYQEPKYPAAEELFTLRSEKGVTQQRMADFFGLTDLATIRKWEHGDSKPPSKRRGRFIQYLWDTLGLHSDPNRLVRMWNDIMVKAWGWDSLTGTELDQYFPNRPKTPLTREGVARIRMEPRRPEYPLIGRKTLLRRLKRQILQGKRLALHGMPGVGKSALATELAHDRDVQITYADGVLWARLGPHGNVLSELNKWGVELGISPHAVADAASTVAWATAIHEVIKHKRFLLVIDGAWRVEDAVAFDIGGDDCVCLLTTRAAAIAAYFARRGHIRVPELGDDDSMTMLEALAPQVVRDEVEKVQELLPWLGGLPLSLRLIGNHLRVQGMADQPTPVLDALTRLRNAEDRLRLSEFESPIDRKPHWPENAPLSLDAVILMSDEALDDEARYALRALTPFPPKPNTFSDEAAAAAAGRSGETIHRLFDRGLLESTGQGRYTLHQSIVDYAGVHLDDQTVFTRFVHYFVPYLEEHEHDYLELSWDYDNITAALQLAVARKLEAPLLRGANAFFHYLDTRGFYHQARSYLQHAEAIMRQASDLAAFDIFRVLSNWAILEYHAGNYDAMEGYCREGLALARELNDDRAQSAYLQYLGLIADTHGDLQQAEALYQQAFAAAEKAEDRARMCGLMINLGVLADEVGVYATSRRYYEQALNLARELKDDRRICMALVNLGALAQDLGDIAAAQAYSKEGLTLARAIAYNIGMITAVIDLGQIETSRGDWTQARVYYDEAWEAAHQSGDLEEILFIHSKVANLEMEMNNHDKAEKILQTALALAQGHEHTERLLVLLADLGCCTTEQGQYAQAQGYLEKAFALVHEQPRRDRMSMLWNYWGTLHLKQKEIKVAYEAFQTALETAQGKPDEGVLKEEVATALYGLAQVSALRGDTAEAERQGQECLTLFEETGHHIAHEVSQWLRQLRQGKSQSF